MINALQKIWDFAGVERKNINKSVLIEVLYAIFHMFQIGAIYFVVLGLVNQDRSMKPAWIALLFLVVSIIGRCITNYFAQLLQCHAGYYMVANDRVAIGNKLKTAPMGYFDESSIGEITGITTTVLTDVENTAPMVLVNILSGFINALVFVVMTLFFEWKIGLLVAVGTVLYLLVTSRMEHKSRIVAPKRQQSQALLVEAVLEQIQGMHIIKAFNLTGKGDQRVRTALTNSRDANVNMEKLFTPFTIGQELVLRIFSVLIVICSLYFYLHGEMIFINTLMCIIISFMVFAQIESAGSSMAALRVVSSSIDYANETKKMPQMDTEGVAIVPENTDITFENVTFSYGDKQILKDISLDIPEKTMTAVVGPSGSGKTTMCSLIARFWDVNSGSITIGNHNIKDYTLESLMDQISMVFQNVYLFQDTIENNIKFGKENASHEEVVAAAKRAACHEFISSLPKGYDTLLGEGGASLSGGEKQRISIARALLKDAPIIILDEITANVDPENEDQLQKAIEELTKNKTIIMIAHRLKTVKNADQIIVLNEGGIQQQGTHSELVKQPGLYANFIHAREEAVSWKL